MDISTSIDYFHSLIDKNGILQFTHFHKKDYRFGYAIEDQARSLIVALKLNDHKLASFFFKIIKTAVKEEFLFSFKSYTGSSWTRKRKHIGEASAEILWALGFYQAKYYSKAAAKMIKNLEKHLLTSPYSRVIAYAILGLVKAKRKNSCRILADRLCVFYQRDSIPSWQWFEGSLFYANALLPWALISAFRFLKVEKYLTIGLATLNFLLDNLKVSGKPVIVGNKGWWVKDDGMALFDQQPIDISYLCLACLEAYKATGEQYYLNKTFFYYSWFAGNNIKNETMIRNDGGCFDALTPTGPNLNTGAESIICYLLASLEIKKYAARFQSKDSFKIPAL